MIRNDTPKFAALVICAFMTTQFSPCAMAQQSPMAQKAIERMKKDVPGITEWEIPAQAAVPEAVAQVLQPFKPFEVGPKQGASKIRALVAVSADGEQTYRVTNDADLAVLADRTALKPLVAQDMMGFARWLATLRSYPEEARILEKAADIPPAPGKGAGPIRQEITQELERKIARSTTTDKDGVTELKFCFWTQLGGGIYRMTVRLSDKTPTSIRTEFLGYTYFGGPR